MIHQPVLISEDLKTLNVTSEAFGDLGYIPRKYTCDGENINPPLTIGNIPQETKSIVLIMEDPDARQKTWVHWIIWNISPSHKIKENTAAGITGTNDFRKQQYGGPCPPSGIHRYFFKVYALDELLELESNTTKEELETAMNPHIIGFGELIGLYRRV